jgi:TonB-linked SusC/RagA family outer membrane protein
MSRQTLSAAVAAALVAAGAASLSAQEPTTVTGTVSNESGAPIPAVQVYIQPLNIGAVTRDDGRYTLVVPGARATGQTVPLTARQVGFRAATAQVTLTPGQTVTQDFRLAAAPVTLSAVVVTGAGTTSTRERLGSTINSVDSTLLQRAVEPQNVVSGLAGKAPNVEVRTQSGEPGASSSIKIRGATSVVGTNQPLFVVDGQPIDNTTVSSQQGPTDFPGSGGTVTQNRAADINPNDIESVEILKGSAAAAIYGARASNGVVLITTKRGRAGQTHVSLTSTWTVDNVDPSIELQRKYGLGSSGSLFGADNTNDVGYAASCDTPDCRPFNTFLFGGEGADVAATTSWGPALAAGTPTYNHIDEIYDDGLTADNTLQVSGGNERTTFFLSGGLTNQNGTMVGPNNAYNRTTVRLKGTHRLLSPLNVGGNFSYVDARGRYVQKGSNVSGLLLGALRTPPEFNNREYLNPESGFHQSYRFRNPTSASLTSGRGYDNPFFTLNNPGNKSELGRFIGNVNLEYTPLSWLRVNYTLGGDYYNDDRVEALPFTASTNPIGEVIRFNNNNLELDHNLVAIASYDYSTNVSGRLTLGQNLNSRRYRSQFTRGQGLIAPEPLALQNTLSVPPPTEFRSLRHVEGYFGQLDLDLYNQLFLSVGLRNDGFSTFGESDRRANYPKASLAWTFTNALGNTDQTGLFSYGKLRAAYGETGREPPVYGTITAYSLLSSFGSGFGDLIQTTQGGQGGVAFGLQLGNQNLLPERNKETEFGFDLGFFDQRVDLGFTAYNRVSTDVILPVPIHQAQYGALRRLENAGQVTNKGVELTLNARPVTSENFAWDVGVVFGRNKGNVDNLAGAEFIPYNLEGFTGSSGSSTVGYAPGVIRGFDFARCGVTQDDFEVEDGTLAQACAGAARGALYIGSDGQPVVDPTERVIADPNPDWTGGLNSSVTLFKRWRLSGLLDIREGGQVWNGTRAALYNFGTHKDTEAIRERTGTFGRDFLTDVYPTVTGPGAGQVAFATPGDWEAWFRGAGGSFGDNQAQFVEDGSFVKLRELAVSYTADQPWVRNSLGMSSMVLRLAGRNLVTWTDYTGLDPESNLGGAEYLTQGIDFFNNPQTRSYVFQVTLNR